MKICPTVLGLKLPLRPYLVETGRLGVCARVHDVDAVAADGGQHQLVACLARVPVTAAAHVPPRVVQLVTHRGHLQTVDHLKHAVSG
jgi:hypothetical protein